MCLSHGASTGSCNDGKSKEHLRDRLGLLARQGMP
jgi:hypothetical protein